ncbi:hypothetical protein Lal_00011128, partial [Lupinus albus]
SGRDRRGPAAVEPDFRNALCGWPHGVGFEQLDATVCRWQPFDDGLGARLGSRRHALFGAGVAGRHHADPRSAAAHPASGHARYAHGPAEPLRAGRRAGARAGACAPQPVARLGHVSRPGSFQERQRHAGTTSLATCCCVKWQPACRPARVKPTPLRAWAAMNLSSCSKRSMAWARGAWPSASSRPSARRSISRAGAVSGRVDRHCRGTARRRRSEHAAAQGRRRHVPAKERGRNNFQTFTSDLDDRVSRRFRIESGLRRASDRNEFYAGLPAARGCAQRPYRQRGSAHPLELRRFRPHDARPVHSGRRRNRPDRRDRPLDPARRPATACTLAPHRAAGLAHVDQPVGAGIQFGAAERDGARRAIDQRLARQRGGTGDDRRHSDSRRSVIACAADRAARDGRIAGAGRFRYRIFIAVVSAPLPDRYAEDRPVVRARPAARGRARAITRAIIMMAQAMGMKTVAERRLSADAAAGAGSGAGPRARERPPLRRACPAVLIARSDLQAVLTTYMRAAGAEHAQRLEFTVGEDVVPGLVPVDIQVVGQDFHKVRRQVFLAFRDGVHGCQQLRLTGVHRQVAGGARLERPYGSSASGWRPSASTAKRACCWRTVLMVWNSSPVADSTEKSMTSHSRCASRSLLASRRSGTASIWRARRESLRIWRRPTRAISCGSTIRTLSMVGVAGQTRARFELLFPPAGLGPSAGLQLPICAVCGALYREMQAPMNWSNEYSRGPAGQEADAPPLLEGCRKSVPQAQTAADAQIVKATLNFPQRPPIT